MNILIQHNALLPVSQYGGTERVVWWLGKYLAKMGHRVSFLVKAGSTCPFAEILVYDATKSLDEQIPDYVDVVHLNSMTEQCRKPTIYTAHGNHQPSDILDINTIFVSKNHAERHGATAFVHNGLDFDEYGKPDLNSPRKHLHFLAKAAWRVKNVKGAIELALMSKNRLEVMGGNRLNIKMGFRFTPYPSVQFHGMVGDVEKSKIMSQSKALLFPVLWHEPFGIAIIESLFMGCAVVGTPYGSLPEIVTNEVGFLSEYKSELVDKLLNINEINPKTCHQYATDVFSAEAMARKYLGYYEEILSGRNLNAQIPTLQEVSPKFLPFLL
jgi:glycosyltransferase involved in cell wall biosynthesis